MSASVLRGRSTSVAVPRSLEECRDDVLTAEEVASIWKFKSIRALRRRVQARRFPAPALSGPARWYRDDLLEWKRTGELATRRAKVVRLKGVA
jgi:hypothetical protein